jgi:hypothetical protein
MVSVEGSDPRGADESGVALRLPPQSIMLAGNQPYRFVTRGLATGLNRLGETFVREEG